MRRAIVGPGRASGAAPRAATLFASRFMSKVTLAALAATFAVAALPAAAEQRANLGGGLIEFLATGRVGPRPQPQPPAYYPSAQGQGYYAPPPVVVPAYRMPAYATAHDALPTEPVEPAPAPRRPQRSGDVAYAPTPRVLGVEGRYERQSVDYDGGHAAGTIVIDTPNKFLYLVQPGGKALRYGIGVGRPGFEWAGVKHVTRKAEWPSWTPPAQMLRRRPDLPRFMAGGEDNPLGARALYLGSSLYRIHGTNEPSTIGQAVSSGCIRMRNQDVIDLYDRVRVGARVIVI